MRVMCSNRSGPSKERLSGRLGRKSRDFTLDSTYHHGLAVANRTIAYCVCCGPGM